MKSPVLHRTTAAGPGSRGGSEILAETVQELLHAAALANHQTGAAVYLPETFLTRW